MVMKTNHLEQAFATYFNTSVEYIVRAPGRVNLIGEHTDYNDGFVMPIAIDRAVWIALAPRTDSIVHIHSLDLDEEIIFDLKSIKQAKGWGEYIKGVAHELQVFGYTLRGFNAVMTGDVPKGAGLSSSAAVELAVARAFASVSGFEWQAVRMAQVSQKAENEWVGVNCGIMDQMASAAAREGHALFLDCRSLDFEFAPLPKGTAVVILDTSTRRGLVDSAYNERRSQCEEAAGLFGVKALRDVSEEDLKKDVGMSEVVMKRARHIVTENARVLAAAQAMKDGKIVELGALLNASHVSLRDDFEVTNEALNQIVACAQAQPSCFGARMTGAGFGGCAVALVAADHASEFTDAVMAAYKNISKLDAKVYVCNASAGASVVGRG